MEIFRIRVCPICTAVAGTWLLMLLLRALGYPISTPVLAMLMGGSVVGIAYQLEKKLRIHESALLVWKSLFMSVGFAVMYAVLEQQWLVAALGGLFLVVISKAVFLREKIASEESVSEIEKKLKQCC